METFLEKLVEATGTIPGAEFKPLARYNSDMDFLLYINQDCSYRAERVDAFLTVLWHPQEERLVGIKLKGFKLLFNQIRAVLGNDQIKETHFLPLIKVLELAAVGGAAEMLMEKFEIRRQERAKELYDKAREFVSANDAVFHVEEFRKAA